MDISNTGIDIYIIHLLERFDRLSNCYKQFRSSMQIDAIHIITTEQPLVIDFFSIPPNDCELPGYVPRQIKPAEKSVFYKHAYAIREISKNNRLGGMILEDDVVINNVGFHKLLYNLQHKSILDEYDIIYFGDGAHIPKPFQGGNSGITCPDHTLHKSKCADSYVVSQRAAIKIHKDYIDYPPFLPVDWDMSLRILRQNLRVGWLHPAITYQGSQSGIFKSLIQHT